MHNAPQIRLQLQQVRVDWWVFSQATPDAQLARNE